MTYKILIVDDSKLARMAVIRALNTSHPDWTRVEAGTAADALRAADEDAPDIALIDFNMPGGDGLNLVEGLRKNHPNMPIALISANHQQQILDRATQLGATFLPKPLRDEDLGLFLTGAMRTLQNAKP